MKNYEFKKVGTVKIGDTKLIVKEYQHGPYFQIGKTKIPAHTQDEAITKYRELDAKRLEVKL